MVDVVDVFAGLTRLSNQTKTTAEKQHSISVSDVWHMWDLINAKYDLIEMMNVFINFAKDDDLKIAIDRTKGLIERGANHLQNVMNEYAIPLPPRPAQFSQTTINVETITDRYIFNRVFKAIKELIPVIVNAFLSSTSPVVINIYKAYLSEKLTMVDNLSVYGHDLARA